MIYLAMSAARQMMNGQAQAAHNLANANTTGFKADFEAYRSMPMFGEGHPSRVFAMAERPGIDFSTGTIEHTGNDLDIAISGEGFIAVQAPDGSEAYTRAGELQQTPNGQLLTADGLPVLGNGGPISIPPSENIVVGIDGTITTRPAGQAASTLAQVDRIRLVKPVLADLVKGADGLFRQRDGTPAPIDSTVTVVQGALERSNVNPVSEMIAMIENARQYETAIKAMDTARTLDADGARVLRL